MSAPQFHETVMGRRFYEVTVPKLVAEIARLNELLQRLLDERAEVPRKPPGA